MANITVTDNGKTLLISGVGVDVAVDKTLVWVRAYGNNVLVGWESPTVNVDYLYSDYASPSGADAPTVAGLIAAMLNT